jgi:DNA-binding NtrC family response regulator
LERQLILADGAELHVEGLSAVTMASSVAWLNPLWTIPEDGFSIKEAMHQLIDLALRQTGGNQSAAARLLGVNRDYLRYRLEQKADPNEE